MIEGSKKQATLIPNPYRLEETMLTRSDAVNILARVIQDNGSRMDADQWREAVKAITVLSETGPLMELDMKILEAAVIEMKTMKADNWKIPAIRFVRRCWNLGLKEAKDAVETWGV
jgi:hypothetical protein